MATKAKKAAPAKAKTASSKATQSKNGAGPAVAARSKDAKKTFGKAAPKTVKPAAKSSAKPAAAPKSAGEKPSVARRVISKVTRTATGAVAKAASVIGKDGGAAKPKGK